MRNKGRLLICMSLTLGLMGCYPSGSQVTVGEEDFEIMDENSGGQLDVSGIDDTDILQGEWGSYDARLKQFDSEQVVSIFHDKSEVIDVQNYEDVQETIYHFKDESMMNIRAGSVYYNTTVEDERYYQYYFTKDSLTFVSPITKERYPDDVEIPNVNKEEAVSLVQDITKELGIEVMEEYEVYAMTAERLEAETDYTETEANGDPLYQWQEEDGVYVVVLHGAIDGLPISRSGSAIGPADGMRITGYVGEDGLILYDAIGIYETVSDMEPVEVVSSEKIAEAIEHKFRYVEGGYAVEEMTLTYFPMAEDFMENDYRLQPMYVCLISQPEEQVEAGMNEKSVGEVPVSPYFTLVFDAQTAGEHLTGGES